MFKSYVLYKTLVPLVQKFPKPWRYSIGEELQRTILEIIRFTCQALYARQPLKEPFILKVIGAIQTAQLFIRLALEQQLITEQHYFRASQMVVELHRMALGWLKSVRTA